MKVVSIIGPKGGIGKTTLSINTAAALTRILKTEAPDSKVGLIDLDLRLPTITSILDSHPAKTFYDLFETLANKTYQVDFIRTLYRILTTFKGYVDGDIAADNAQLGKALALYQYLNIELFHFAEYDFGDHIHELFLHRGEVQAVEHLQKLRPLLLRVDIDKIKQTIQELESNSRPVIEEFVNYVEEYDFSILGGEVPILGKRSHRKRINEPAFLVLFLEFLQTVFQRFQYVVLDTPAGGVNHLSSLMNFIDQVIFVFDISNNIAINGSIDALHTFIDYYEDFYSDFLQGKLTGLDKAYVNRLIASQGQEALLETLKNKKMGILFNRCEDPEDVSKCLSRMREYLDTLDKYETYKNRIEMIGMLPNHKIINITNNRGALFYEKDRGLTGRMDLVAENIVAKVSQCPTLENRNQEILSYLRKNSRPRILKNLSRMAGSLT